VTFIDTLDVHQGSIGAFGVSCGMENALAWSRPLSFTQFRALAWPKEHGSWSLALEPLALGLIVAPSTAGACLALAVVAAFFARRPLRTAWREARAERRADARKVVVACAIVALAATAGAVALTGVSWLFWLLPTAAAGGLFLSFDLRNAGRDQAAEIAGSAAFAALPAALAILGGASSTTALALAIVMVGRAVPTVLCVRAALRAAKTGRNSGGFAIAASLGASFAGIALAFAHLAPWMSAAALTVLGARAIALLGFVHPAPRARTVGMMEAALGVAFVLTVGCAWNL
jgi:hypothetical protein